jgi:hypothetical protein
MNETDKLPVTCGNCGKRLRVKATLEGKRLKCPSCSAPLDTALQDVKAPVASRPRKALGEVPLERPSQARGWLIAVACAGVSLVVLVAFLVFLTTANKETGDSKDRPEPSLVNSGDKTKDQTNPAPHEKLADRKNADSDLKGAKVDAKITNQPLLGTWEFVDGSRPTEKDVNTWMAAGFKISILQYSQCIASHHRIISNPFTNEVLQREFLAWFHPNVSLKCPFAVNIEARFDLKVVRKADFRV